MQLTKTPRLGLTLIQPTVREDPRGYFTEVYHQQQWYQQGIDTVFVQENESYSRQGVLRGLHYQLVPYAQAKWIRVVKGHIWDVALDLRKGSPTFGQWEGVDLSDANKQQLLVPAGYAHGFVVISQEAWVVYKCSAFYQPDAERGIHPLDPHLSIPWPLTGTPLLSAKDQALPPFASAMFNFLYP
jgi:dTDP-4-dehydrorhamnose 3,5-epimerase